jgi:hypothetical protein
MACSAVEVHRSFGGTFCLHFQGRLIIKWSSKRGASSKLSQLRVETKWCHPGVSRSREINGRQERTKGTRAILAKRKDGRTRQRSCTTCQIFKLDVLMVLLEPNVIWVACLPSVDLIILTRNILYSRRISSCLLWLAKRSLEVILRRRPPDNIESGQHLANGVRGRTHMLDKYNQDRILARRSSQENWETYKFACR